MMVHFKDVRVGRESTFRLISRYFRETGSVSNEGSGPAGYEPSPSGTGFDSGLTGRLVKTHDFSPYEFDLYFAFTYRSAYRGATRKSHESSWGHTLIFRTVPS